MPTDSEISAYWKAASLRTKAIHRKCLRDGDKFDPEVDYMSLPDGYWLPLAPPLPDELL